MKDYLLTLGLGATLLHAACAKPVSQNLMLRSDVPALQKVDPLIEAGLKLSSEQRAEDKQPIDRAQAIATASEDAVRNNHPLKGFRITTCEKRFLWVIIFDGGGFEYFVSKRSGEILGVRKVPHAFDDANSVAGSNPNERVGINETEAIAIAKRDFVDLFIKNEAAGRRPRKIEIAERDFIATVNEYNPVVCELTHSWRIFFEDELKPGQNPATLPTADAPDYVIDKKTGKIIYRQHY